MGWNDLIRTLGPNAIRTAIEEAWRESEQRRVAVANGEDLALIDRAPWRAQVAACTNDGKKSSQLGCELILANAEAWDGVLCWNDFAANVEKRLPPPWPGGKAGPWEDADTYQLISWFHRHWQFEPQDKHLAGALSNVSRANTIHPVRDWLNGLPAPTTSLLDTWLADCFSSPDNKDYLAFVGRSFLISAVARVMRPGCKADNVLVLDGAQGLKKSTALLDLFNPWSSDQPILIGDKDAYMAMHGVWMLEIAELDAYSRADAKASKAFFSQRNDRYRPPYGTRMVQVDRQTVFTATTNQLSGYLKDPTGDRRYWPVRVMSVDHDFIRDNREQLFAEALDAYRAGVRWWAETPEERALCEAAQDRRSAGDPWEQKIIAWTDRSTKKEWATEEILTECIGFDHRSLNRTHQNRLAEVMQALGFHADRIKVGKRRLRGYMTMQHAIEQGRRV